MTFGSLGKQIFPDAITRNAKQVCWRGVTDFELPRKYQSELNEAWGKGSRFGFVKVNNHQVYWYGLKSNTKYKVNYPLESLS